MSYRFLVEPSDSCIRCHIMLKFLYLLITVVQCVPSVDGAEELVKDLNCNNDLYKFVRVVRDRLQAAIISGTSCYIFLLPFSVS